MKGYAFNIKTASRQMNGIMKEKHERFFACDAACSAMALKRGNVWRWVVGICHDRECFPLNLQDYVTLCVMTRNPRRGNAECRRFGQKIGHCCTTVLIFCFDV